MKKVVFFAFLCGITAAVFAQTSVSLDLALESCAAQFKNQLTRGARAAVLNIEARSGEFSEYITDTLSAKLVSQNHLAILERGRILRALEAEQDYQMSGNVSDETASSVGKQLGAELVITGSFTPRGNFYSMNIRVVHVETARIVAQWVGNDIQMDQSIASMDMPVLPAVVRFAGTSLEINDQDSLIADLQRALSGRNVSIELVPIDEAPAGSDYNFLITLRVNTRASMLSADLTVAFRRGSRVLKQSDRHTYSELDLEYVIRKGGEIIVLDNAFFQSLPGIIAKQ